MKKLVIALLVLIALLVAADRVIAHVAEGKVAARLQSAEHLADRPEVSIHGFPFVTQALRGRYDDIEARVVGLRRGAVRVATVDVHLRGAELPVSEALHGTAEQVPVRQAQAQVLLAYRDLNALLKPRRITVAPADGALRVRGAVDVVGREVSVSADGRLSVSGDTVRVRAANLRGGGLSTETLVRAVGGQLDFSVRTPRLPFALALRTVSVGDAGVAVTATAEDLVLRP